MVAVRKPRLRVTVYEDMAFIYDPHVLESPPHSVFVSWSDPKHKHFTQQYLRDRADELGSTVFHTFVFPNHLKDVSA